MKNKMKIKNLRIFVEALNALPIEIKNNEVDMRSPNEPVCGTAGCHGGLISIVANDIPKLKSLYKYDYGYGYLRWVDTLAKFLGFAGHRKLRGWALHNSKLWGNDWGFYMFGLGKAFGEHSDVFSHSVIINHWTKVLERVEELNNKGETK